jgi:hypothetical protein
MKKLGILITGLALTAAAPLASASEAQLELLPKVGGAEMIRFVSEKSGAPAADRANASDALFYRHTGGVPPQ